MNSALETFRSAITNFILLLVAAGNTLRAHWALSFFSIGVAFVIWFIVQDVENPRVEQVVPVEGRQAIPIEILNQSDDVIILDAGRVQVRVDAREEDIPELRASDFRATIDAGGLVAGQTVERAVTVEMVGNDSIRVLDVIPATVQLNAVAAVTEEFLVTANLEGELPAGYAQRGLPVFTPEFITVTGTREQIDSVASVEADIPLNGLRNTTTTDVALAARTANGNQVDVVLSQPRVQVTLPIEPTFAERQVPLRLTVAGQPAPGYQVTGPSIDPTLVTIVGPPGIVDGIEFLSVGRVDVTGAEADVNESRTIEVPPNVTANVQTAIINVGIAPISCGPQADAACSAQTFIVPVVFEDIPPGLAVAPGAYTAEVRLSGALPLLGSLNLEDILAIVSLEGGTAGTRSYPAQPSVPPGVTISGTPAVEVTLVAQ